MEFNLELKIVKRKTHQQTTLQITTINKIVSI